MPQCLLSFFVPFLKKKKQRETKFTLKIIKTATVIKPTEIWETQRQKEGITLQATKREGMISYFETVKNSNEISISKEKEKEKGN